jgi:hypothetical protein
VIYGVGLITRTAGASWWMRSTAKARTYGGSRMWHIESTILPVRFQVGLSRPSEWSWPLLYAHLDETAHVITSNVLTRAADVHLNERRKLVLVARKTPPNTIHFVQCDDAGRYGRPPARPRGLRHRRNETLEPGGPI